MPINSLALIIGGVVLAVLFLAIILKPIKWIAKLLLNALLGLVLLFVVNYFGSFIGLNISVGWVSALVAGILGIPGIILLVLIEVFFV